MPLLDHFQPPLGESRHWESFHTQWASCIASQLNRELPEGYFAEAQIHPRSRVEVVAAALDNGAASRTRNHSALVAPDRVLPAVFLPSFGVHVYETARGPKLVAAVELVAPANKDDERSRQAFAIKCASYLQHGQGLVVADIVTSRDGCPMDDLFALLGWETGIPSGLRLKASAYRPVRQNDREEIELRVRTLEVGKPLPALPLALDSGHVATVDLEASYEDPRKQSRL
jgi:hypothetical protein